MLLRILIAEKDRAVRARLARLLREQDVDAAGVGGLRALLERLPQEDFDLLLVRRPLLPEDPAPVLARIRQQPGRPETVVLADKEEPDDRARLQAAGALAVLFLGLDDDRLRATLSALFERRREQIQQRLTAARPDRPFRLADFASASPSMQHFMVLVTRMVDTDSALLILGETGVGKERLARAISAESPRRQGPFIAVNCAAIPENLLESELFGHEEGSFTGAIRMRRGRFELAHRGTLFLDEVGELPTHLQAKLLRVLEERQVQRVGAERPIEIDVRVMAAANRDLDVEMHAGRFRPDLYYRLAVVSLTVPPLRERREDIPQLARGFLEQFRRQFGRPVRAFSDEALDALVRYAWPGNVRELINVIERSVLICPGRSVQLTDLPRVITGGASPPRPTEDWGAALRAQLALRGGTLRQARAEFASVFERAYLDALLQATAGRIGEAARRAGVNERTLYDMLKRHDLRKEAYRLPAGSRRVDGPRSAPTQEIGCVGPEPKTSSGNQTRNRRRSS